jgi:hypothetical protein
LIELVDIQNINLDKSFYLEIHMNHPYELTAEPGHWDEGGLGKRSHEIFDGINRV